MDYLALFLVYILTIFPRNSILTTDSREYEENNE